MFDKSNRTYATPCAGITKDGTGIYRARKRDCALKPRCCPHTPAQKTLGNGAKLPKHPSNDSTVLVLEGRNVDHSGIPVELITSTWPAERTKVHI